MDKTYVLGACFLRSFKIHPHLKVHLLHALPGTENNHPRGACVKARDMPTYIYHSAFY